jgi:uncharacterized protein YnzC (UPF0291/DUF896 family)
MRNLYRELFKQGLYTQEEAKTSDLTRRKWLKIIKKLDKTAIFKVEIENGDYILVKGKGIVAMDSLSILN